MGGLVQVLNNEQLDALEAKEAEATEIPPEIRDSIVNHIRARWEIMKRAKIPVNLQMLDNLRAVNGEYHPTKLAAMRQLFGEDYEPVYMMITAAKVNAAIAWVRDILFQPNQKPWDISPTPEPELPEEMEQFIRQKAIEEAVSAILQESVAMGVPPMRDEISMRIQSMFPELMEQIEEERKKEAERLADKEAEHINDQLVEGNWYKVLDNVLFDIFALKGGIMKKIYKKVLVRKRTVSAMNFKWQTVYEHQTKPFWEKVNPFDLFLSPDAVSINDGDVIQRISVTARELLDYIGIEGFSEKAIRKVVLEYRDKGHREWIEGDQERRLAEGKDDSSLYESDKIDCLEYWGSVSGATIKEWKINNNVPIEEEIDDELEYDIKAYLVGTEVICAVMNDDPEGNKPYFMTGFMKRNDSPWHLGIPEVIADCQSVCNASARSIVYNIGLGGGPQIEVDKERCQSDGIWPLKVWHSTNNQMVAGPAVKFYQPTMVTDKLIQAYDKFSAIADEHCGIPAYAHGNPNVGGAGDTASGLSMFMTASNRGVKSVIKNIDDDLISPSIEDIYYDNLDEDVAGDIPDMIIRAMGTMSIMAKEQEIVRKNEFLAATANPIDVQLIGPEIRRKVLLDVAKQLNIDIGDQMKIENMPLPQLPAPAGPAPSGATPPPPAPKALNEAGAVKSGQDFRAFKQGQVAQ